MVKCKAEGCERTDIQSKESGLCSIHYHRWYRETHKDQIRPVAKARNQRHKEKRIALAKIWSDKNRERKVAMQKAYLKRTNYKTDKTPKRMAMRRLRAMTNMKYPILENQLCELCLVNKATQRHHTTIPYHVDRFVFICKRCHDVITALTKGEKTK